MFSYGYGERKRHSVANLPSDRDLRSTPHVIIWEALQPRSLKMRQRPVFRGMQIATFLRLKNSVRMVTAGRSHRVGPSHRRNPKYGFSSMALLGVRTNCAGFRLAEFLRICPLKDP